MWRDRTNLYMSYRQSFAYHQQPEYSFEANYHDQGRFRDSEERLELISGGPYKFRDGPDQFRGDGGDVVVEMKILRPRWGDVERDVRQLLKEITKHIQRLDQLHLKHVLPDFTDDAVRKKEEDAIKNLTHKITQKFQNCQQALRKLDMMVYDFEKVDSLSRSEHRLVKNLKRSLAARIGKESAVFRKKQASYLKKIQSMGAFSSALLQPKKFKTGSIPNSSSLQDSERTMERKSLETVGLLNQSEQRQNSLLRDQIEITNQDHQNDGDDGEREQEIEEIAQGIIELAKIFQDVQTIVIDQGSLLDRIDYNVERVGTDVGKAENELVVASGYQHRGARRKVILLLVLLIVGANILLFLKISHRSTVVETIGNSGGR